jgi:hypothetical protein
MALNSSALLFCPGNESASRFPWVFNWSRLGTASRRSKGFQGYMRTIRWEPFMAVMRRRFWTLPAVAVHSKLSAGDSYTTLELKIAYHKAISEQTGKVRAEGRVLTFGRRVAFSEAKLLDKDGRLLASATSTLLVIQSQGITQELGDERRKSGS